MRTSDWETKAVAPRKTIRLRNASSTTLGGLPPGGEIELLVGADNKPIDSFWRARMRDATRDGCVEIVSGTINHRKIAPASRRSATRPSRKA